ncbi:Glycosyltransferase involved in cell wall bisynthesis [Natronoarchaeum philippinense]|uniref:Glycosyltransferase involved in cell wall bisynthesis n=1 Tax=Natronoarchaeum philippinense TaxID=558529 RepID=A0A285P0Y5_NATPI|nr:glycosyltransferase family 4 protein [Natronoarchaeum philippinense]SNZ15389.1 Glycosyltransferase involved in cell wall bisynthesis [Natronoarchaeum philippinense]
MSESTVVFFHIASGSYGGGSHMLYRLLSSIDQGSINPVVLAQRDDTLTRKLRKEGIRVEIVPFRGSLDSYNEALLTGSISLKTRSAFRLLQFNAEARSVLRDADVIWCKNLRALLSIIPYSILSDARLLWNIGLGNPSTGFRRYLNTTAIRATDEILIESPVQAERIFTESQLRRARDKLTIISKGIDTDRFSPSPNPKQNEFRVGMASLITPRKRVEDFISAATRINESDPDIRFSIAGSPPDVDDTEYLDRLERLVASNGIEDVVTFEGWVDDMPSFYNSIDVFVLPSQNEGIPGSVKEAMATETPVIATNVGGVPEIVDHQTTGYLVKPKSPSQIADYLLELRENPDLMDEIGQNSRQRIVNEYSMEAYLQQYETILQR